MFRVVFPTIDNHEDIKGMFFFFHAEYKKEATIGLFEILYSKYHLVLSYIIFCLVHKAQKVL